jgi:uncharacterized protein YuzE
MGSELVHTTHARDQMLARNYSESDVEQALANPVRGTFAQPARNRIEHFGCTADGRIINVVTDRAEAVVITVVEQQEVNMHKPLDLKVDFVAMAGYLRYRALESGVHVARTQRISDDVFVDFNAESQILGMELLAFDDEALDAARRFAAEQNLECVQRSTRFGYDRL